MMKLDFYTPNAIPVA